MFFTNVIKPTHLCNLDCTYCYNDDVRDPVMQLETLERTIAETFAHASRVGAHREVNFIWHGGEPMLAGLDFFREAVALQARHGTGAKVVNSLQTNGVLIDDAWIEFLQREGFEVSISMDGPQDLHDAVRKNRGGKGSFQRAKRAIDRVQAAGIPVGSCLVISRANAHAVERIYDFFAAERLPFNVIPLNRSGGARAHFDDLGIGAEEYADAWIRMYDRWFDSPEEDYIYCMDFVLKTRAIALARPADCIGLARCADTNVSVDPVGDVYPCASLSGEHAKRYGNLLEESLTTLMESPRARDHRDRGIDPHCVDCKWQHVCHGGCHARAHKFFGNHHERDYYCPSLFRMYEHVAARLTERLGKPQVRSPLVQLRTQP